MKDTIYREDVTELIKKNRNSTDWDEADAGAFYHWTAKLNRDIDKLPSAERTRWIPVSERLPDEFERDYLVTIKRTGDFESYTENDIAYFDALGFHKADEVLAWMPLPKPYKRG